MLLYAVGQLGWSLAAFAPTTLLNYYYLPPEDGNRTLFPLLLTLPALLGLVNGATRLLDAFVDPYIAAQSDRSRAAMGRRRWFMLWSFLPFALLSFAVFVPPFDYAHPLNLWWVAACLLVFHLFLGMYTTPYTALIAELGHTPALRLRLSALVSVAYSMGIGIGSQVYSLQQWFEQQQHYPPIAAFRWAVALLAAISAVCMLVPVCFVNEPKYSLAQPSEQTTLAAMRTVWANTNFRVFALSDFVYWIAFTFIQSGMVYYVTVLLRIDKTRISVATPIIILLILLLYYPIMRLAEQRSKKQLMQASFLLFALAYGWVAMLGWLPLSATAQALLLIAIVVVPIVIFSILPTAMVADIADQHAQHTGKHQAAMFFGVRIWVMKMGVAVANYLFGVLLLLGKNTQNDTGIRLTALCAMTACLVAYLIFRRYNDTATPSSPPMQP